MYGCLQRMTAAGNRTGGILSDTHAHWDERYVDYFTECDEIWHAGDILEDKKVKKAMTKDLTTSEISRQNILNNPVALPRIREDLEIKPLEFNGVLYVTKQMAADFLGGDLRTITNCLNAHEEELKRIGYRVLKGSELREFKFKVSAKALQNNNSFVVTGRVFLCVLQV